jgi:DNA-binding transcriptional ArsR family regulator
MPGPGTLPKPRNNAEDRLDRVFHALGDRTRRALLARLSDGPAMITELAGPFAMSLPAVSKHLRVLESAGLVERTVQGRVHQCSLHAQSLIEIETWLVFYRPFWADTLAALAQFVEEKR